MTPASASRSGRPPRYGAAAIGLHWLLALGLVAAFALGTYMADLPFSPQRLKLYNWHKWAGVTILALSLLRLLWRLRRPPPPMPAMPRWQALAASANHAGLYLLFLAVPLVGWAYSSAAGFPVVAFGILPLPDFVPVDRAISDELKSWHRWLGWALAGLSAVHVGAALKHHFLDRDGLLLRMWPR